ncbi:hypothetical protein ACQ86N_32800 [Puia sp. P3]|uniref:hypothetical protein n=1 Tax=Puia sp. P3 TaxID=3423952 RepID=UPI003D669874
MSDEYAGGGLPDDTAGEAAGMCGNLVEFGFDGSLEGVFGEGADFVLLGEGEQTLLELVKSIRDGAEDFASIRGLGWMKNGMPFRTAARPVMRDLDAMPLPAWDLVDIESYRRVWLEKMGISL